MSDTSSPRAWCPDPEVLMPPRVQARHHALCVAARDCYGLRSAAEHYGDFDRSRNHQETGDVYFARAAALLAEWE